MNELRVLKCITNTKINNNLRYVMLEFGFVFSVA